MANSNIQKILDFEASLLATISCMEHLLHHPIAAKDLKLMDVPAISKILNRIGEAKLLANQFKATLDAEELKKTQEREQQAQINHSNETAAQQKRRLEIDALFEKESKPLPEPTQKRQRTMEDDETYCRSKRSPE